jgi:hypothetical protein
MQQAINELEYRVVRFQSVTLQMDLQSSVSRLHSATATCRVKLVAFGDASKSTIEYSVNAVLRYAVMIVYATRFDECNLN